MKKSIFVIWHDNGTNKECEGYTDYTEEEVAKEGGIFALLADYHAHGIYVYDWNLYSEHND